jgi:hypothetical protein
MGSDAAIKVLENSASMVVSMSGDFHDFVKYFLAVYRVLVDDPFEVGECLVLCYKTFRYDFPCRCFWEFPEFSVSELII